MVAAASLAGLLAGGAAQAQQQIAEGTAGYRQDGAPVVDKDFFRFSETGDLTAQIRRGVIRVLVGTEKTSLAFRNNQPTGFEFAMMQEYRAHLRTRVRRRSWPVQFVFVPMPVDELIPALLAGHGDIVAAGLVVTPELKERVAFSTPYLRNVDEVIVTAPGIEGIATLDDLVGREVFVRPGTSYAKSLDALNADLTARGKTPVRIRAADPVLATEDILNLVNGGYVEITVTHSHLIRLWQQVYPDMIVRDDLVLRTGAEVAWAVRKDNPELLASVNRHLRTVRQGTLVGNTLINRYLMRPGWFANPLDAEAQSRLDQLFDLFERYGRQYNVEPSLLAAIAFQESRLDNNARSHVGAIGVMQIMPATAAAPPLELSPIEDVEVNVHAGARYFSFVRDNVFNDPALTPGSRINFTLASYNAGRTRIQRLRREAARQGLDPDLWFGNVDRVVRRRVGLEPIEYVANIRRFHLEYQLLLDARARSAQARQRVPKQRQ